MKNTAILFIHCPDVPGIIAEISNFINVNKGNIIYLDQYVDYANNAFFMRVEWDITSFLIPKDSICAPEFKNESPSEVFDVNSMPQGQMGLDIGPVSQELFSKSIAGAGTVVWNGPMGVSEWSRFAAGTEAVAKAVADSGAVSIIGGGDSTAAIEKLGFADRMTHVSTGGGASLEFLEGLNLPGIACLLDK